MNSKFVLECAVCKRQVDELHSSRDIRTNAMLYLVRCHGQEQRVELPEYLVERAGPNGISIGRAFELPELEKK